MSIAESLKQKTQEYVEKTVPAITEMERVALALKSSDAAELLANSRTGIVNPEFRLIVLGRFKNGKSTFLNVLLGRTAQDLPDLPGVRGGILPMDELPATARLTTIRYGEEPSVTIVRRDGSREKRSVRWFVEQSALKDTASQNEAAFRDVQEFEVVFPFENGRAGIVLLDCPGTDEDSERTLIAHRAVNECDAAIVLFRTDALAGEGELEFVKDMMQKGLTSFFTVVNLWNGRAVDRRLMARVWDRRVRELEGGPEFNDQDFGGKKIYFLDARSALEAKLAGDAARLRSSGIELFEQVLTQYLERERRRVHVRRWVDQADHAGAQLTQVIERTLPVLAREHEDFQRRYEEIRPQLKTLEDRRAHLPRKFTEFYDRCSRQLRTSFEALINRIRDELPGYMNSPEAKLTSLGGVTDMLWAAMSRDKKQRVAQEAFELAVAYARKRIKEWSEAPVSKPGAAQVMEPLIEEFLEELKQEVKEMQVGFERMHLKLTGYSPAGGPQGKKEEAGWWGRIAPAAVGLAFGPDLAVLGAANGWKGMGKSVLVHVGVVGAFAFLAGGPLGWGTLGLAWLVAFVIRALMGSRELEREVKEQVVKTLVYGGQDEKSGERTEGLRGEPARAEPALRKGVADLFGPFEEAFMREANKTFQQEADALEELRRKNALGRDEKLRLKEVYEKALSNVKLCRQALADARRMVEATA